MRLQPFFVFFFSGNSNNSSSRLRQLLTIRITLRRNTKESCACYVTVSTGWNSSSARCNMIVNAVDG